MPNVTIKVLGDVSDATDKLDKLDQKTTGFGAGMAKMNDGAKVAAAGVLALGAVAADAASDAQQAAGAVETVFGTYADQARNNAASAAQNVGLASTKYNEMAAIVGSQLKTMGQPMEGLAGQTDQLITLGADLAATYGGTTADAVAAVSSLLRGERDPIERYGVAMKEADVQAQKAAMGLSGLTGEADKQATAQATLALLSKQTSAAQGAFAREADSAAGQVARGTATAGDAAAQLGQVFLPAITAGGAALASFAKWAQENSTTVLVLAGVIGAIALGIVGYNAVVAAMPALQAAAAAAQWLLNAAMTANPVGLIVIGIIALIAIVVLLVMHWDKVKAVALAVWAAIADAVTRAASWVRDQWNAAVERVVSAALGLRDRVVAGLVGIITAAQDLATRVGQFLVGAWDSATAAGRRFVDNITGGIRNALSFITDLANRIATVVGRFSGITAAAKAVGGIFAAYHHTPADAGGWAPAGRLELAAADPTLAAWRPAGTLAPTVIYSTPITVNGALDPTAVAKQLRAILNTDARNRGVIATNGTLL